MPPARPLRRCDDARCPPRRLSQPQPTPLVAGQIAPGRQAHGPRQSRDPQPQPRPRMCLRASTGWCLCWVGPIVILYIITRHGQNPDPPKLYSSFLPPSRELTFHSVRLPRRRPPATDSRRRCHNHRCHRSSHPWTRIRARVRASKGQGKKRQQQDRRHNLGLPLASPYQPSFASRARTLALACWPWRRRSLTHRAHLLDWPQGPHPHIPLFAKPLHIAPPRSARRRHHHAPPTPPPRPPPRPRGHGTRIRPQGIRRPCHVSPR